MTYNVRVSDRDLHVSREFPGLILCPELAKLQEFLVEELVL